jgi:hypothetical protein
VNVRFHRHHNGIPSTQGRNRRIFYLVDDTVAAPPWNKGKLIRQKKRLKLREQAVPYEITGAIGNKISSTKIFNTSLPLARAYLPSPKTCHYTQVSPPRDWSFRCDSYWCFSS